MRRPVGLLPRAEITAPGPQFELFNRASFCRFSGALERPHFFYRNQPVNRRFTPRYQECQDFTLRPLSGTRACRRPI